MREIEIKLRIKDFKGLEEKLRERGCILSSPIRQEDIIYSKAGSTSEWEVSKEGQIVMRIRRANDHAEFNLKEQRSNEMDNLEYETAVDNPNAIHQILARLGFEPQVEVKKVRRKGKLGEYEICLDAVDELGNFVELEKLTSEDADPNEVREELFKTLEDLGLSRKDEETRGYDTQMYFLSKK
jgi:adenylate cyclase class 2